MLKFLLVPYAGTGVALEGSEFFTNAIIMATDLQAGLPDMTSWRVLDIPGAPNTVLNVQALCSFMEHLLIGGTRRDSPWIRSFD